MQYKKFSSSLFLLATVLLISALIAGCGDDGSAEGDTIETSSLNKAQFTKRANEICEQGSAPILELLTTYIQENESGVQDEEELTAEAIKEVGLPILEDQFDAVEDLGAPQGDARQIEALLMALREGLVAAEQRQKMTLTTNIEPDFRRAGKLARQYGIEGCAYG